MDLPVKPRFVFAPEQDLDLLAQGIITPQDVQLRLFDFDIEGLPPLQGSFGQPVPFSTQPPNDGGFFFECELDNPFPFFPGVPPGGGAGLGGACPHVPLTSPGGGYRHWLGAPPPVPTGLCSYTLIGSTNLGCGDCPALPNVIVRSFCPGPCPPNIFVLVPCEGGGIGFCVAFYSSDGCP